jgi:hypothetical protein
MACALLTLMAFNRENAGLGTKEPVAMILSNQNSVAYATGGEQTGQNHIALVTFDSTNQSVLGSSIGFTPITNLTN